jgi:hypothetical protein
MKAERLNEHDANQGAQSKGEFLGMSGTTSWYLLGAIGATQLMLVVLWGMLGVSLMVCLGLGVALCLATLIYVFCLKNNRPAHYDSDFFESVLIDAGIMPLAFGPRVRPASHPFSDVGAPRETIESAASARPGSTALRSVRGAAAPVATSSRTTPRSAQRTPEPEESAVVPLTAYESLQSELADAQDQLEDALAEQGES